MAEPGKMEPELVRLRPGTPPEQCVGCINFKPPAECDAVLGEVNPGLVCDLFSPVEGPGDQVAGPDQSIMDMLGGLT